MKYQKPLCECGNELNITEVITCDKLTEITTNGKRTKKHTYTPETGDGEHLECTECGRSYEISYDIRHRIIRGEEYLVGMY